MRNIFYYSHGNTGIFRSLRPPTKSAHRHTKKSKIFSKKLQNPAKSCKILQKVARFCTFRALFSTLSHTACVFDRAFSPIFVHFCPLHLTHFTKNALLLLPPYALLCRFSPPANSPSRNPECTPAICRQPSIHFRTTLGYLVSPLHTSIINCSWVRSDRVAWLTSILPSTL